MVNPRSNEVRDCSGFKPASLHIEKIIVIATMIGVIICLMRW